jgi:hypothetical protein
MRIDFGSIASFHADAIIGVVCAAARTVRRQDLDEISS